MNDVFKAIADPTRRSILLKIAKTPSNINTLQKDFDMSRPAISKHVKILEDCQLIKIVPDAFDGRQRNCYAQLQALEEVNKYLSQLSEFWESRLQGLGNFLDKN